MPSDGEIWYTDRYEKDDFAEAGVYKWGLEVIIISSRFVALLQKALRGIKATAQLTIRERGVVEHDSVYSFTEHDYEIKFYQRMPQHAEEHRQGAGG